MKREYAPNHPSNSYARRRLGAAVLAAAALVGLGQGVEAGVRAVEAGVHAVKDQYNRPLPVVDTNQPYRQVVLRPGDSIYGIVSEAFPELSPQGQLMMRNLLKEQVRAQGFANPQAGEALDLPASADIGTLVVPDAASATPDVAAQPHR